LTVISAETIAPNQTTVGTTHGKRRGDRDGYSGCSSCADRAGNKAGVVRFRIASAIIRDESAAISIEKPAGSPAAFAWLFVLSP
jgi:hypothetical protein